MGFSVFAAIVLAALIGGGWSGYHFTRMHYEHVMEKEAIERRAAEDQANLLANRAALRYEEKKAAQVVRVVTVTREINHAIDAAPAWGLLPLPDGVRLAIAAAGPAPSASEPDRAVQLPDSGSADQRPIGAGLRLGTPKPRGLFGEAPIPR